MDLIFLDELIIQSNLFIAYNYMIKLSQIIVFNCKNIPKKICVTIVKYWNNWCYIENEKHWVNI